jgi:hypothetical protein
MEDQRQRLLVSKSKSVLQALRKPPHMVVVRGPLSADAVHWLLSNHVMEPMLKNAYVFENQSVTQIERIVKTTTFRGKRTAFLFMRCEAILTTLIQEVLFDLHLPMIFVFGPEDKYRPGRNALASRCTVVWCGSEISSYLPRLLDTRNYAALRVFRDCSGIQQLLHDHAHGDFEQAEQLSILDEMHHRVSSELSEYLTESIVICRRPASNTRSRKRYRDQSVLQTCIQGALAQTRSAIPEQTATLDYLHYRTNDNNIFRLYRDATNKNKLELMNARVIGLQSFSSSSVDEHIDTIAQLPFH